jgi:hypothetical protein
MTTGRLGWSLRWESFIHSSNHHKQGWEQTTTSQVSESVAPPAAVTKRCHRQWAQREQTPLRRRHVVKAGPPSELGGAYA